MGTVETASPTPTVSILVADDFREWREQVRNILQARPEWQVICEAGDGQQAVHLAAALHPDIVLLDIGMPIVNGIAAARQVREVCPGSRVVFLTQNLDSDIMNEARAVGADGYVLKACACSELLPAIETALRDGNEASVKR